MFELSKRLSLIASFVKSGRNVCDVGTDHGYLPAFLFLEGRCKKITATDINRKPLENAGVNLERLGVSGVRLILCDGLSGVTRADADTVIIAGMGGEVISGIIDRTPFLRDATAELVLQPTTAAKELRVYLARNGFAVEKETAISENGKIYSVMLVRFTGEKYNISDVGSVIGILKPDGQSSRQYIEKQYNIAAKCADSIKNVTDKQNEYDYYLNLSKSLKNILGE